MVEVGKLYENIVYSAEAITGRSGSLYTLLPEHDRLVRTGNVDMQDLPLNRKTCKGIFVVTDLRVLPDIEDIFSGREPKNVEVSGEVEYVGITADQLNEHTVYRCANPELLDLPESVRYCIYNPKSDTIKFKYPHYLDNSPAVLATLYPIADR